VLAAAIMAGSSIIVVVNSLRLERLPEPVPSAASDQSAAESAPAMHTSSLPVIAGQAIP
jgi:Cu2+-exporting ATPase